MRGLLALVLATATVLAGCGGESRPASDAARSTTASMSESTGSPEPATDRAGDGDKDRHGRVIETAGSAYGSMLFDRSGQAIYLFDRETTARPQCYRACAEAWPPVLTRGPPQPSGGARPALLGTTSRTDGSRQVTYDGHPLYFYAHEGKFEVLCHNVSEFGGVWLVVTPGGEPAA